MRLGIRLLCVGLLVCAARAADLAAPSEYSGKPIAEVRFEPAEQPVAKADLERMVRLKTGATLTLSDVRATIKQLYASGRYSSIEVDTQPAPRGVSLVVRTREQWFVGPVEVRGDAGLPPNAGQLAAATRLELGAPFSEADVRGAVARMSDLLERNGLYQATIEPRITRDPLHQQVELTFLVDSGKRARLTLPNITGDTRMPPEKVARAAKYKRWFRWRRATEVNTQGGVERIRGTYEKEDRLTASANIERREYDPDRNRVKPTIRVEAGPRIQIGTTGGKISRGKLKDYVPVFEEGHVNRDLLVDGARNLRDYFQNKGYFGAEVDFRSRDLSPDHREITYVVELGERRKLVAVEVHGNRYFTRRDIRERMFLEPKHLLFLRHGRYSQAFVRRDRESIEALYRSNGFPDVKVAIDTVNDYRGKPGRVAAVVNIEEGPQYLVAKLTVNGITRPDREHMLSRLASAAGQPYSEASVAMDRDYLIGVYQDAGFPDAVFEWRSIPAAEPHRIEVEYTITEGKPRFVRDVLISGMRITRNRVVEPNVLLKPGDPLSWTRMGNMQRRLYNLGIFDKVDMAVQNPDGDTEEKYVLYHLEEGHRYYLGVGAGAEFARIGGDQSSLANPAGQAGFAPRASLEVSRLNMLGLGHSLNFKSRYSTLNRRASLNYSAPRYRNVEGRNISVTALYDDTRDVRTFTAKRLEGSGQLSQRFSKATTALWRYTWRDVRVDEGTLKIDPLLIPLLSQPARIGMLSASLIHDRRDDPTNARRGVYNTVDVGLAQRGFGGNKNFLRALTRNSWYKTFRRYYTLATNTSFGWIRPMSVPADIQPVDYIPIAERFFGGGSTSHRGFPDNQAGPRDPTTGFPLGGNALLFHTTEIRFPLMGENISGVFFHDMGNIFSGLDTISFRVRQRDLKDFNYMVHAAGFGVRYRTPLGPIRVDLAYSMNPPSFYGLKGTYQELLAGQGIPTTQKVSRFQFFFSIGQAF